MKAVAAAIGGMSSADVSAFEQDGMFALTPRMAKAPSN